ncbi:DEAD/DEAH box helicase [Anaerotruncus colihominis]|uniref:Helicase C-terminal domain protein n=1 Tax=Anaerotruncus colihominis DSM 17241 TaxID=445972 RepID=B0PE55_9FIRM|nr:DEAD/DEAH box helicase family protein [Anaerotruncus colihominis]EDS10244.1 helicase C-terminal domain protein [Anaerotruncus colihominis DSM 17241]UWN76382.1 DEAD/DEAH box helicase family protein [Anaerotruncus colihominis]
MCKYDAICQKLYPYQKDILDELLANSNDDPHMHTMVYLPTGGGKTRVAAAFAILEGIFKERTIIWFAHSHHLLEQAHKAIRSLLLEIHAGKSAVIVDPFIEHNEIFIHCKSGKHMKDITKQHKIVILSVCTAANCDYFYENKFTEDAIVIIDEAHHAVANQHQDAYGLLTKNRLTIGLTATPTRTLFREIPMLYDFYDNAVISKIDIAYLIEHGFLAKPEFINESPLSFSDNQATHNSCIKVLEHFLANKDKYGKTLIFAANKPIAEKLKSVFEGNCGTKVWLTHSCVSPDVIDAFKASPTGVLINIEQLIEGVDIPDIQTVIIIGKPKSEITAVQMIGRALRKPAGIEKEVAYIVGFLDPHECNLEQILKNSTPECYKENARSAYTMLSRDIPKSLQ